MQDSIFSFFYILFFIIALSLSFLSFSHHKRRPSETPHKYPQPGPTRDPKILPPFEGEVCQHDGDNPTRNLAVEDFPSDSDKWGKFSDEGCNDPNPVNSGQGGKKKKRKAKKKKMNLMGEENEYSNVGKENAGSGNRPGSVYLCPFTSSSSAMQRKIKQEYDELVKCNESKKLKLSQVVQFANSLVDARSELQHKADVIQRKFIITKALLCKADRSSFDRLRQQIYKLELEQKRLEEDASVYNWLQQQLKLSPAYKKMLEIGASMEEKVKSHDLEERRDDEFADISFEELLAQEKKDSFWQKNGKSRLCSSS